MKGSTQSAQTFSKLLLVRGCSCHRIAWLNLLLLVLGTPAWSFADATVSISNMTLERPQPVPRVIRLNSTKVWIQILAGKPGSPFVPIANSEGEIQFEASFFIFPKTGFFSEGIGIIEGINSEEEIRFQARVWGGAETFDQAPWAAVTPTWTQTIRPGGMPGPNFPNRLIFPPFELVRTSDYKAEAQPLDVVWKHGGHGGICLASALSPDDQWLATAAEDLTIQIWSVPDRSLLQTLSTTEREVHSLAFTPDGSRLVSGDRAGRIQVWEIASARILESWRGHSNLVNSLSVAPQGNIIISTSWDGTIKQWDQEGGQLLPMLQGPVSGENSAAFAPDGETFAARGEDGRVCLWQSNDGSLLKTFNATGAVLEFSPDGKQLAIGDSETVQILNVGEEQPIQSWSLGATALAFSPEGTGILIGVDAEETSISFLDVFSGSELWSSVPTRQTFHFLEFFSDAGGFVSINNRLLTSRYTRNNPPFSGPSVGEILVWESKEKVSTGESPDNFRPLSFFQAVDLADSQIAGGSAAMLSPLDPDYSFAMPSLNSHRDTISSLVFSPDGETLASASSRQIFLQSIHAEIHDPPELFNSTNGENPKLAFTADGEHLLAVYKSNYENEFLTLGQLNSTNLAQRILIHDVPLDFNRATSLDLSQYNRILSTSYNYLFWAIPTPILNAYDGSGKDVLVYLFPKDYRSVNAHIGEIHQAVFSPNASIIASGGEDQIVKIWNVNNGTLRFALDAHTETVTSLAFSPHGRWLASGGEDHHVNVWNLDTGALMLNLTGHRSRVTDVEFIPNGTGLLSVSYDHTLRFWTLPEGNLQTTLDGEGYLEELAVSPDGQLYALGRLDGTVLLGKMPEEWRPSMNPELRVEKRNNSIHLTLDAPPGRSYQLQSSFDLHHWDMWLDVSMSNRLETLKVDSMLGPASRFFRVKQED